MGLSDIFGSSEKIQQLEQQVEELEDEKEKFRKQFEAEKQRRSKISTEKQEAERELKKLKQKLESRKQEEETEETGEVHSEPVTVETAVSSLEKLFTVESADHDLVTVYSDGRLSKIEDYKGLKNSLSSERMRLVDRKTPVAGFLDEDLFDIVLKCRTFFESEWFISDGFRTDKLLDFIQKRKTWVVVSSGSSMIVEEEEGEIIEKKDIKSRVDQDHTQGGFSQKRFERKRDKQIREHVEMIDEELETESAYIVGEKQVAGQLEGNYLGGFDDNKSLVDALYNFHIFGIQD